MLNDDLMRSLRDEREREIAARLRVRGLLRGRRPEVRWLRPWRPARLREAGR